jgi:hypothetical protein
VVYGGVESWAMDTPGHAMLVISDEAAEALGVDFTAFDIDADPAELAAVDPVVRRLSSSDASLARRRARQRSGEVQRGRNRGRPGGADFVERQRELMLDLDLGGHGDLTQAREHDPVLLAQLLEPIEVPAGQ